MAFPYKLLIIKKGKSLKIKLSQHYAIQDDKKKLQVSFGVITEINSKPYSITIYGYIQVLLLVFHSSRHWNNKILALGFLF